MLCKQCGIEMPLTGQKGDPETGAGRQLSAVTRLEKRGEDYVVLHVATAACQNPQCSQKGVAHEIETEVWRGGEADVVRR